MWFFFYEKLIYYEVSFLLTLIFKYISVEILLSYIYIFISLKTSNILENESQMFERGDCTIGHDKKKQTLFLTLKKSKKIQFCHGGSNFKFFQLKISQTIPTAAL